MVFFVKKKKKQKQKQKWYHAWPEKYYFMT